MMKDFRDWLPWSSRSVAATLGAVVLLAASAATRDFAPAAFVHRAISEAVDHTLVADMDGDGRNDVALQIHRDDHHLGKLTGRKTPPGSEPPENPVSYQSIAPRSYTIIHELPQQCFRPDDEANPTGSGRYVLVTLLRARAPTPGEQQHP